MAVISDNLSAIRALASARIGFDMTTWRLEDYLNLQSFACLWGIVPGSIADEESPFNECAHAYLAAARALLLQLREAPGVDHDAVEALIRKIEVEMLANGASLTLCRYSDEPFNTNEVDLAALAGDSVPSADRRIRFRHACCDCGNGVERVARAERSRDGRADA